MSENPRPYGRPLKGRERRIQVGVYMMPNVVDMIDDYIAERYDPKKGQYSRSEFINEAVEKHMRDLGLIENKDDEEKQG